MSRTPAGVQKACAIKVRAHFSFPMFSCLEVFRRHFFTVLHLQFQTQFQTQCQTSLSQRESAGMATLNDWGGPRAPDTHKCSEEATPYKSLEVCRSGETSGAAILETRRTIQAEMKGPSQSEQFSGLAAFNHNTPERGAKDVEHCSYLRHQLAITCKRHTIDRDRISCYTIHPQRYAIQNKLLAGH